MNTKVKRLVVRVKRIRSLVSTVACFSSHLSLKTAIACYYASPVTHGGLKLRVHEAFSYYELKQATALTK
jgi:hypothetical protein